MNYRTLGLLITTGLIGVIILLGLKASIVDSISPPITANLPQRITIYAGELVSYSDGYVAIKLLFDGNSFQVSYYQRDTGISHFVEVGCFKGSNIFIGKPYIVVEENLSKYVILEEII
jgi:hypothetical protein